jgi:hypothetical protein
MSLQRQLQENNARLQSYIQRLHKLTETRIAIQSTKSARKQAQHREAHPQVLSDVDAVEAWLQDMRANATSGCSDPARVQALSDMAALARGDRVEAKAAPAHSDNGFGSFSGVRADDLDDLDDAFSSDEDVGNAKAKQSGAHTATKTLDPARQELNEFELTPELQSSIEEGVVQHKKTTPATPVLPDMQPSLSDGQLDILLRYQIQLAYRDKAG